MKIYMVSLVPSSGSQVAGQPVGCDFYRVTDGLLEFYHGSPTSLGKLELAVPLSNVLFFDQAAQ